MDDKLARQRKITPFCFPCVVSTFLSDLYRGNILWRKWAWMKRLGREKMNWIRVLIGLEKEWCPALIFLILFSFHCFFLSSCTLIILERNISRFMFEPSLSLKLCTKMTDYSEYEVTLGFSHNRSKYLFEYIYLL